MTEMANRGYQVLYVETTGVRQICASDAKRIVDRVKNWINSSFGFREIEQNLVVLHTILLPFPYHPLSVQINKILLMMLIKIWSLRRKIDTLIAWVYLPTPLTLKVIESLSPKSLIYQRLADFSCLTDKPDQLHRIEDKLMKKADIVVVQGNELVTDQLDHRPESSFVLNGVSSKFSSSRKVPVACLELFSEICRPVAGYIGAIHKYFDFDLIDEVSTTLQDISFVFVGPRLCSSKDIIKKPNVYFVGEREWHELTHYIERFDVCLVPYKKTKYTESVVPSKVLEYMMIGKPIVATPLKELINIQSKNSNLISLAETPEKFAKAILSGIADKDLISREFRRNFAMSHTWPQKLDILLTKLSDLEGVT
jgi:glycosyltransferase involved in cell wall biosynthesis